MISASRKINRVAALAMIIGVGLLHASFSLQAQDRQLTQNSSAAVTASKRLALVIGNGAYTNAPPLKNPPNDARDMAATLKLLGFSVSSAIDADQRTMKRLIREFGQQLKSGGQGLFYYAGHGVQMRGHNYLIPANADITSEADVEDQAVDLNLVLGLMDDAQNGLNIVILDACRNNPFARSFRSAGNGLAQVDAPTGTLIAYATSPGRVASDGQGSNGLYTSQLLNQMRTTGIGVEEVFKRVRAEVQKQTSGQQVPWESSSLVGNFYFAPTKTGDTNSNAGNTLAIDPTAFELSYWDTIKNSTSAEDFKAYVARYPQGQFVELAKNRITNLQPVTKPAEPSESVSRGGQAEITFWDSIKTSTTADDYRAYLEKYPNGEFAGLARRRLAPLEASEKEKSKAVEESRNIKRFKGAYMLPGAMGDIRSPGTIVITPNKIEWVYDDIDQNRLNGQVYKPYTMKCSDLAEARTDDVYVREIRDGRQRTRFQAESADAANDALAAMRYVCANPGKNFPGVSSSSGSATNDQLAGTTWKGDSSGGDKHYEFQFLSNSEVVWSLKWGRLNDPTFRGTYTLNGNQLRMVFDAKKVMGGNEEVAAVLSEDSLTGSWNFGRSEVRPDNGMYKFTVRKVK